MKKPLLAFAFLSFSLVTAAEVSCETVQEGIKKIRCKYMEMSQDKSRQVSFQWVSPDNPADNRVKTITVPAGHISVFDYRYFGGRAEGKWVISVTELDTNKSVSTEYMKDSNAEVAVSSTDESVLEER